MKRVRIAVTTGGSRRSVLGWYLARALLGQAGAEAVRIRPSDDPEEVKARGFDGLVLTGGGDIHPDLYGGTRSRRGARIDTRRDEIERRLLDDALDGDRPVLGICRGAQLLNVQLGGSLHENAWRHHEKRPVVTLRRRRGVVVRAGTLLAQVTGAGRHQVNSLHFQAVDQVGEGLVVSARDDLGMTMAVESLDHAFVMGVQWHPELLPHDGRQRSLFHAMVAAARQR